MCIYFIILIEGDNVSNQPNSNVDTLNVIQKAFGVRSSFSLREMMRRASAAVRSSKLLCIGKSIKLSYVSIILLTSSYTCIQLIITYDLTFY